MKAGIRIFFVLLGGILWSACGQSGGNAEAYERVALSEEMATDEVSSTVMNKTADFVAPEVPVARRTGAEPLTACVIPVP